MNRITLALSKCIAMLLVCVLVAPSMAYAAPKPLTPEQVHQRLLKRGLGNWVYVQLDNGVVLAGRIVTIEAQSFSLQLHNDPEITPLLYSDIVELKTGPSKAAMWTIVGAGIGGMVALALVAHHEMSNMKQQMPTLPTQPVFP